MVLWQIRFVDNTIETEFAPTIQEAIESAEFKYGKFVRSVRFKNDEQKSGGLVESTNDSNSFRLMPSLQ